MLRSLEEQGTAAAEALLGRLLDRIEARPDRQTRVIERPPPTMLWEEKDAFEALILKAAAEGAVGLERHRLDRRIDRVILLNPGPLYRLIGRPTPGQRAGGARDRIREALPSLSANLVGVLDAIAAAWEKRRNLVRDLGPDDIDIAVGAFSAVHHLLRRANQDELDMRTFSRRATGDSKFVEANMGRIADILRQAADYPDYLDAGEILAQHGIRKWSHACLMAGPLSYKGTPLPTEPYIGIAPEMAAYVGALNPPTFILTIENIASFNRQVREARDPGGIVVYTGGFPSEATLASLTTIAGQTNCPIYHWGDIDAGGVKIAYHIEQAIGRVARRLDLHLMSPDIARRYGKPTNPAPVIKDLVPGSVVSDLVAFLASEEAHVLEQEELDPGLPERRAR